MKPFGYINSGFSSVHTSLHLESLDWYLTHDPAVATVLRDKQWLCGHVHNIFRYTGTKENPAYIINVGVDLWDYTPLSIDQIQEFIKEIKDARE